MGQQNIRAKIKAGIEAAAGTMNKTNSSLCKEPIRKTPVISRPIVVPRNIPITDAKVITWDAMKIDHRAVFGEEQIFCARNWPLQVAEGNRPQANPSNSKLSIKVSVGFPDEAKSLYMSKTKQEMQNPNSSP